MVSAQQATSQTPWTDEDSAVINTLALYPDSVRMEIFQACEYPAIIVTVASLQKNSSADFAKLVSGYSKTEQEDILNLSGYPNLISRLVDSGKKSKKDIKAILSSYPSEIHTVALKYGRDDYDLLKKVDELQMQTNQKFDDVISSYAAGVQKTFKDLLQYPEVMSLLNAHLSFSISTGDKYKRDPGWVMHKSDSIAAAQAKINTEQQFVSRPLSTNAKMKGLSIEPSIGGGFVGFNYGCDVNYMFNNRWGFTTGLNIQRYTVYISNPDNSISPYPLPTNYSLTGGADTTVIGGYNTDVKYNFNYLEVPLLCRYVLPSLKKNFFYAEGGFTLGFLESTTKSGTVTQSQYIGKQPPNSSEYDSVNITYTTAYVRGHPNITSSINMSVQLALGLSLKLSKKLSLIIDWRFYHGILSREMMMKIL